MTFGRIVVLSKKCNQPVSTAVARTGNFIGTTETGGTALTQQILARNLSTGCTKCRCWPNPPCHHHTSGNCNYSFHDRFHNSDSMYSKGKGQSQNLKVAGNRKEENSTLLSVSHNAYSKTKFKPHPHTGMNLLQNTVLPPKVGPASAVSEFRFVATSTHDKGA